MTLIQNKGYTPVIPIKRYRNGTPQDPLRIQSDKNAMEPIYKKRTLIEGLFGNIKQKLSSHIRAFNTEIAKLFALLGLALLNVSVLVAIEKEVVIWILFPNSANILGFQYPHCLLVILCDIINLKIKISIYEPRISYLVD